jgi:hypothetical protein
MASEPPIEPAPAHDPPRRPGAVERGVRTTLRRFAFGAVVVCAIWATVSVGWSTALAIVSVAVILFGAESVLRPPSQSAARRQWRRDVREGRAATETPEIHHEYLGLVSRFYGTAAIVAGVAGLLVALLAR